VAFGCFSVSKVGEPRANLRLQRFVVSLIDSGVSRRLTACRPCGELFDPAQFFDFGVRELNRVDHRFSFTSFAPIRSSRSLRLCDDHNVQQAFSISV